MENVINNPGLQHLEENIFLNLNYEDLKKCQFINQSTKDIWKYPMFWIKWIKFKCIQESLKKSDEEKINISYLKCNFKRGMALGKDHWLSNQLGSTYGIYSNCQYIATNIC